MNTLGTDDVLALTGNAALEHAGKPEWFNFFLQLYHIAARGMGGQEKRLTWSDDGTLRHRVQLNSLLNFCSNVFSQRGDDGIIRRIFRVLGIEGGFFVEIGASDGLHLSNCHALAQRGWSGCAIEADHAMAELLRNTYRDRPDVICLEEFVALGGEQATSLDQLALAHFPRRHVDFLSIDINGLDYRIFEAMQLRPTVVCVEGGFSWHPEFTQRVRDEVAAQDLQQPLAVILEIGKQKSYAPICFNQNTYFIVAELADRFAGFQNDAVSLWRDAWLNETQAFRDFLVALRKDPLIRQTEGDRYANIDFGES